MSVRAKMQCITVKDDENNPGQKLVSLYAVYEDGEANKEWSKFTPWGEVTLAITNPEAFNQFVQGKVYYVDFTEAE